MEEDINNDGKVEQLNLKVQSAVVHPNNTVKVTASGSTIECPARVESLLVSVIADNTVDILVARQR